VQIQLLRHATLILTIRSLKIIVDPMLSSARVMDPITSTPNQQRNPLVDLPLETNDLAELINSLDAVLVTHTHMDHWDAAAEELLPNDLKVFCQPEDEEKISEAGFTDVHKIEAKTAWEGIDIARTGGRHGTGRIGEMMGPVSGYVISVDDEPKCYIAGDTIWCDEVRDALQQYNPSIVVVNAGAAQFLSGDPITMTAADVLEVCNSSPSSTVIAVHMEAINHCLLTRGDLRSAAEEAKVSQRVEIPLEGETLTF
jgi:L-ascorbate metabolism protein UlaG (beta-lactamase superfamily)